MPRLVIIAGILALVVSSASGCASGDLFTQPDPQSLQIRSLDVSVGGSIGPRHGPYGR